MKHKSDDLLKDAIADAKTVRATALANAKLALEEAFTPKLQSMLSAKIREEADDDEDEIEDVADELEDVSDELDDLEPDAEEESAEEEDEVEPEMEDEVEPEMEDEVEPEMEDEVEPEMEDEPEEEDELDLEAIIRELEGDDEMEDELEPEMDDEVVDEDDDEELDLDIEDDEVEDDEMDEEFDLSALLGEDDEVEDEVEDDVNPELEEANKNLEEAYGVIHTLQNRINEINLLNSKLLYANKLFKAYNLDEGKKVKVIETIDRASTVREVKLVYSTLAESYKDGAAKKAKPSNTVNSLTESMASKTAKSTKPKKKEIITEENEQVKRFRKLAGITK